MEAHFSKNDSFLPSHAPKGAKQDIVESLQGKYDAANTRLYRLEEELDFLLHSAYLLREQQTDLTQGRLKPSDTSPTGFTLDRSDELIDEYLVLMRKSGGVNNMIKILKEECASTRSECNYLVTTIRRYSPRRGGINFHNEDSLVYGGAESGFTDTEAVAQRIVEAEDTATGVGAVVGAFGAGIAYTTLFSATRGRLDLISWAFTCFVVVMLSSAGLQLFAPPRHGQISKLLRMEYSGSAEQRLLIYVLLVGLPTITGFVLLAMSVALLDAPSDSPIIGSQLAIRVAGYLPVVPLGFYVVTLAFVAVAAIGIRFLSRHNILALPTEDMPAETRKYYPTLLFPVKDKLHFLPGGDGYATYRQRRIARKK